MGSLTDWKSETTLGDLATRTPLWMKVAGKWEWTTPYELLERYGFPRFLTVDQVEFVMETLILRDGEVAATEAA